MICKNCGHDNARPWFEPVFNLGPINPGAMDEVPKIEPVQARWACEKCHRYSKRNGELWEGIEH